MLPAELIKNIRKLEIRTNRMVDEIIGGAYHSVFKGRGIEFDEVREYTPEDDVRDIDWNVTARMGTPFIKKYVEERELSVMLVVDVSQSGNFGSGDKTKRDKAIEVAAMLAFSAIRNNDKVGLLLFSDEIELYLPPRSGRKHTLRLIRELVAHTPAHTGTNIDMALQETIRVLSKRAVVFLISDFLDTNYRRSLRIANRRHDVIAVRITDKTERQWPLGCRILLEDSENGSTVIFGGSGVSQRRYIEAAMAERESQKHICDQAKVDLIDLDTNSDALGPMIDFFRRRRNRQRHS